METISTRDLLVLSVDGEKVASTKLPRTIPYSLGTKNKTLKYEDVEPGLLCSGDSETPMLCRPFRRGSCRRDWPVALKRLSPLDLR